MTEYSRRDFLNWEVFLLPALASPRFTVVHLLQGLKLLIPEHREWCGYRASLAVDAPYRCSTQKVLIRLN